MEQAIAARTRQHAADAYQNRSLPIGSVGGGYTYALAQHSEWWNYENLNR